MTEKELIGKVHSAVYHQCQRRGYAAPVDVLMEVGVLPKQKYEDWRFGRVDYLERVCTVNYVNRVYGISKLYLFLNSVFDSMKYNISPMEYFLFHFWEKNFVEKEKWAGTQAGDSAAVQQKRKLGN